jgi:hypothetical protein
MESSRTNTKTKQGNTRIQAQLSLYTVSVLSNSDRSRSARGRARRGPAEFSRSHAFVASTDVSWAIRVFGRKNWDATRGELGREGERVVRGEAFQTRRKEG